LKKMFDDSINFFWSAQTSQIYRELKAWEQKGCIVSSVHPSEKGPDKRVYSITEQGIESLKNWLSDMLDEADEDNRNAFLLRLFLLSQLGLDELVFQLKKRLKKYRRDLKNLKDVEGKMQEYAHMEKCSKNASRLAEYMVERLKEWPPVVKTNMTNVETYATHEKW